jgi:hypothetical protein
MHIYAFGSIVRGDISIGSDVDLLAIVNGDDPRFDPEQFSVYSYDRVKELWLEGNPFAWHLALESKLLYSSSEDDFLRELPKPSDYSNCLKDCEKFFELFCTASTSLLSGSYSIVFDLSMVFLAIRNFATCYSLGVTERPDFSRSSALSLGIESVPLTPLTYGTLERARILCTRGRGTNLAKTDAESAVEEFGVIRDWMEQLLRKAKDHGRI